jgi:hypothetical protein
VRRQIEQERHGYPPIFGVLCRLRPERQILDLLLGRDTESKRAIPRCAIVSCVQIEPQLRVHRFGTNRSFHEPPTSRAERGRSSTAPNGTPARYSILYSRSPYTASASRSGCDRGGGVRGGSCATSHPPGRSSAAILRSVAPASNVRLRTAWVGDAHIWPSHHPSLAESAGRRGGRGFGVLSAGS